jgi:hypothetical protein
MGVAVVAEYHAALRLHTLAEYGLSAAAPPVVNARAADAMTCQD